MFLILSYHGQGELPSPMLEHLRNGDTLTLFAEYDECGEWGGHIEKVKIVKKDKVFWAYYYSDTAICGEEVVIRHLKSSHARMLTEQDKHVITIFINKLKLAAKSKEIPESNSYCYFKIITKRKKIEFLNWKKNWTSFREMREELFGP